jgi:hypothetical protein
MVFHRILDFNTGVGFLFDPFLIIVNFRQENISMAVSEFYIVLNVKSGKDFQTYGKFFLGSSRKFAEAVFRKLKGNKKVSDASVLYIELMETNNELPINIQVLSCSLEELSENCKMITKETFKQCNLEEM